MTINQHSQPIVIYGAPRSGTTYLAEILNSHPDIFISNEIRLFVWLHQSLNVVTQNDHALLGKRDRFIEHLRAEFPDLVRTFYRDLRPSACYWGDKNPHYASRENNGCLETIASLFGGARFVHIIRDGRDVVSSLVRKRHVTGEPWAGFVAAHAIWKDHVDIGCAFGRSQPADRYFELRYEDLVHDDLLFAERLFGFLGIDMHPSVTSFCQDQRQRRTPFSGPMRDLGAGVLNSDWSTVLTAREQFQSLELLGEHLIRYGYETEESINGIVNRVAKRARSFLGRFPRFLRRSGHGRRSEGNALRQEENYLRAQLRAAVVTTREMHSQTVLLLQERDRLEIELTVRGSRIDELQTQLEQMNAVKADLASRDVQIKKLEGSVEVLQRELLWRLCMLRIRRAASASLPVSARVLVLSKGDEEILELDGRNGMHFPQADDGGYLGYYPTDSAEAMSHLHALIEKGADHLLVPCSAFWWLEHYTDFGTHLERYHGLAWKDESCMIFQLRRVDHAAACEDSGCLARLD